jgi:phosphatidylinositol-4,5-bisphosphate 3-kinase catalytic subunit alpha/beta/delta
VNDFRHKISVLGEDIANKRSKMTLKEKILYQYPPKLASSNEIPNTVKNVLENGRDFLIVAKSSNEDISVTLKVSCFITPIELKEEIIQKMTTKIKNFNRRKNDYILKICGQEEYIFGEHPLIQFLYIQDRLSREEVPMVVVKYVSDVYVFTSPGDPIAINPGKPPKPVNSSTLRKKGKHRSSWDISDNFEITIQTISNLNVEINKTVEIGIQAGLFHGGKVLCEKQKTFEKVVRDSGTADWSQILKFDIKVQNIPRMARLCLVVYETAKNAKSNVRARRLKDSLFINPIAWVNTTVFDYKNQLKTGGVTLYTWTYAEDSDSEELLHPLGTVEPNPRTDETTSITMSFFDYNTDCTILYPEEQELIEYAERIPRILQKISSPDEDKSIISILQPYMHNDRINDISEQERKEIWERRFDCMRDQPDALPCLLYCVEWNNRDDVAEVTRILSKWPQNKMSVERTLELLDYAYADQAVRRFAVECLKKIKDEDLQLYLLQLVQAIKHESYLYCDLVEFLLQRALNNQRIGHFLFWHLRSEIQVPSVQVRFSLILEAYLRSSKEHISILMRQWLCLEKLRSGSEQVKKVGKEKAKHKLMEFLNMAKGELKNITSPLNPSFRCKEVRSEKCKVMDSKMRPIWTVYENVDQHGEDINIIFKNGDDLRQDMLTLQMLRIMDRIWKSNGHDFRLNTYSCISMERRLGMIEVVLNAETIANIQKEKGIFSATAAFKKGSLYSWLKDYNTTDEMLNKACHEFTLSCAGYCVATYVLGVADRHSDNIMVKKNGQLFHIDFGHILGHFKEKFGIRRERVPFVLTHDFVYVINKGRSDKDAEEFKKFQKLCEDVRKFYFLSLKI